MSLPRPALPGSRLGRLARDESGVVTIFVVVALSVLLGLGALVIDAGRLYNLNSEMQAYADYVALAAAAELDGEAGAIDRATKAALGDADSDPLVEDGQSFATGASALAVGRLIFLSRLGDDPPPDDLGTRPAGDNVLCSVEAGGATTCTADHDGQAQFVEVTVEAREVLFLMLPVLRAFGVAEAATTGRAAAQAVAGFTREVCNFPPLMMCNPYETATNKAFTPIIGQQVLLKSKGAGSAWAPGDFGLLDVVDSGGEPHCTGGLGGSNRIRCVMGLVDPNTQCVKDRVNIRPGQSVSVHVGLNLRFDIWDPPLQSKTNDPAFAPSANVTKGRTHAPNQCRSNQLQDPPPAPGDTVRIPRDRCFDLGTCERFGDAQWDTEMIDYWTINHPGLAMPGPFQTRFEYYRHEIDNGIVPDKSGDGGEDGNPMCAAAGINNPLRDRRELIVAVINCIEHNVQGSTDDVPVIAFARMFLTEPVGYESSNEDDLRVEMLGVAEPGGDDGILHEFPQLYR
jgi:hypothetical protein